MLQTLRITLTAGVLAVLIPSSLAAPVPAPQEEPKPLLVLRDAGSPVLDLTFSSDGAFLASAGHGDHGVKPCAEGALFPPTHEGSAAK